MSAVPTPQSRSSDSESAAPSRHVRLQQLRQQLRRQQKSVSDHPVLPTGITALDAVLPDNGIPGGSIVEWISHTDAAGATTAALCAASGLLHHPGVLAVVDEPSVFHPVSLPGLGIPHERLLLIRPQAVSPPPENAATESTPQTPFTRGQRSSTRKDALWALEQLAGSSAVRVVIADGDSLTAGIMRRLQLATDRSGAVVFLIRRRVQTADSMWADLRLRVRRNGPVLSAASDSCRRSESRQSQHHAHQLPHDFRIELMRIRGAMHVNQTNEPSHGVSPA